MSGFVVLSFFHLKTKERVLVDKKIGGGILLVADIARISMGSTAIASLGRI